MSRIIWLKESDANTKFFHNSVKSNLSRNTIHHLRDNNGMKITYPSHIKLMVEQFYFGLLCVTNSDVTPYTVDHIKSLHSFCCPLDLAARLSAIPTALEVKITLLALPKNKSPGPYRFSAEFFIFSWDLVGSDFTTAIIEFFTSSKLLRQINSTIISHIPKQVGAKKLSDRPISCCNTVYKVISRILAARLK